ncbi:PAS domain-containing protein [Mycobacterium sp.]|uniref:PAS domain-containing protein n=1 Tax=Mycobacterium sp. TaxID=1785 RepID=UPI0025FBB207|nr:PAS domain-containing protein [Mycobacterium sp.]MBW0013992.1 PAS domain-containing protein [Mycobacterium sp.]
MTKAFASAGTHCIERRPPATPDPLPSEQLRRVPALEVLERLPAPVLAVDRAGTVLFANRSFCDMVGYSFDELVALNFGEFCNCPRFDDDRWVALTETGSERLVELRHKYGHLLWAGMSKSVTRRRDDTVALVSFRDRTEELWVTGAAIYQETGRLTSWPNRVRWL